MDPKVFIASGRLEPRILVGVRRSNEAYETLAVHALRQYKNCDLAYLDQPNDIHIATLQNPAKICGSTDKLMIMTNGELDSAETTERGPHA